MNRNKQRNRRKQGEQEGARRTGGSTGSRRKHREQEDARETGGSTGDRRKHGIQEDAPKTGGSTGHRRKHGKQEELRSDILRNDDVYNFVCVVMIWKFVILYSDGSLVVHI